MRKNVLALSIAAMIGGLGFAGSASAALEVNESGIGHMLLVPYYTAQNGNMTVLHVVNTDTVNGKAMKVRFRGASNSDDVLDFQVFMSPGDVWTAAVLAGSDGNATLSTGDKTCTLPTITAGSPVQFVQDRLPSTMSAADKAANTREGYVEIFNMADIDGASAYTIGGVPNQKSALYTATKHVAGVAPCTSSVLNGTLATGAATVGLLAPSTGLTGSWYVINVPQTTTYSGAMNAIVATTATRNVFSPQQTGAAALFTADPLMKAGLIAAQQYDVPDLSTPYETATPATQAGADAQATALSAALDTGSILNQYANDPGITAKTDWVFSMPTRRYSIAANYAAAVSTTKVGITGTTPGGITLSANVVNPPASDSYRVINGNVTSFFTAAVANTTVNTLGQICTSASGQTFFDREETSQTSGAVFSPGQVTRTLLCGEVSVLSFADAGVSVLGSTVARSNVTGTYVNGWGSVGFSGAVPLLGSAFIKLTNPAATAGVSGTYGITWPHVKR